ncbi:DUF2325 domain-containing protein [Fervidobacterium riparium]|nr:hypothetical protein IB67_01210 [Fervidobacterium riparium]
MSALIIGGDYLGKIEEKLKSFGFERIKHCPGRWCSRSGKIHLSNFDIVIVLVDFIDHNTVEIVKRKAKAANVKVVFSKRCWSCLHCELRKIFKN